MTDDGKCKVQSAKCKMNAFKAQSVIGHPSSVIRHPSNEHDPLLDRDRRSGNRLRRSSLLAGPAGIGARARLQRRPFGRSLARSRIRSGLGSSSLGCSSRSLGRRIPCHCLSVLALIAGWFAAKGAPVDPHRALLCRHRCQSLVFTTGRCRSQ